MMRVDEVCFFAFSDVPSLSSESSMFHLLFRNKRLSVKNTGYPKKPYWQKEKCLSATCGPEGVGIFLTPRRQKTRWNQRHHLPHAFISAIIVWTDFVANSEATVSVLLTWPMRLGAQHGETPRWFERKHCGAPLGFMVFF